MSTPKLSWKIRFDLFRFSLFNFLFMVTGKGLRFLFRYNISRRDNVFQGNGLTHLPLLASYSRSGTNWIRYTIEFLTKKPTPGQLRLIDGRDYIIDRAHQAAPVMHTYPSVILVLRDYHECLIRHHQKTWKKFPTITAFMGDESLKQPVSWYINNIVEFNEYSGTKLLVYYEDIVKNPESEIRKLGNFFKVSTHRIDHFLKFLDFHYPNSVKKYTSGGHQSASTGGESDTGFHSRNQLTMDQQIEMDQFFIDRYPEITQKYLVRYLRKPVD